MHKCIIWIHLKFRILSFLITLIRISIHDSTHIGYCVTNIITNMSYLFYIAVIYTILKFCDGVCIPTLTFGSNSIIENAPVSITCEWSLQKCFPFEYVAIEKNVSGNYEIAMKFFPDSSVQGFTLTNNISYEVSDRIKATSVITQSVLDVMWTIIEDNGHWKCHVAGEETNHSLPDQLEINSNPEHLKIDIDVPDFILVGTQHSYTCSIVKVYPELTVLWNRNDVNLTNVGIDENNRNGDVFDIKNTYHNTLSKKEDNEITCFMATNSWSISKSAPNTEIFVPTGLDGAYISHTHPTPEENFTMSCIVSGTTPTIAWQHNNSNIDPLMFRRTDDIVTGTNFSYSEPTALRSTLVWILPEAPLWCQELDKYSGTFQCTGNSAKGPTVPSVEKFIGIQYAPILTNEEVTLKAKELEEVELKCDVECANPSNLTYHWSSVNNKPGIEQNQPSIWTNVTKPDFSDIFICNVSNGVGYNSMRFTIEEIIVDPTTVTEDASTVETTSDGGNVTTPKPPNTALIIANAVIWSLCGVVAIVLVCLALYHYRQIQNGKNNQGENSEEINLTEDEVKPGTSHGCGEYADISPSVGVGIPGVTNHGIYAEVQTLANTQVPISQQHSETPKTKRAQAPAAPKSPMNTPQPPNSPLTDRHNEPTADYSPTTNAEHPQKRHESPNKPQGVKQNTNGAKPSVPFKPNITSLRSSGSSFINPAGAPYDNAEVNLYANCDQQPVPKNQDGTIMYADLALQQEDPYYEGAPPVPKKHMNDQEPVQYASIKHSK